MSLFHDYDSEAKTHFNAGRMFEACQAALCADSSDVWIQYILGTCYRKGSGVERDFSKAFQWFRKSAEQGCSRAMFRIAFMYHNGEGVTRDDEKFFGCLKEAAAAGLAEAQWNLALCFRDGVGCEKDEKECNRWLRAAADGGNLDAIHYLQTNAYCCVTGEASRPEQVGRVFVSYSSKDRTIAASLVEHLERKGVACWIAPRNIPPGAEYADSIVEAIDRAPAVIILFSGNSDGSVYCKKEMDVAVAKEKLIVPFRIEQAAPTKAMAFYLSNVHWVDAFPDPSKKFDDLIARIRDVVKDSRADEETLSKDENALEIYNRGVAADLSGQYETARTLYENAVSKGLALAENNLGCLCLKGKGGARDVQRAIALFKSAASKGLALAYESLGRCYWDGIEGVVDAKRAYQLFLRGAELGDALSQYELARCLYEGKGCGIDKDQAVFWLKQAELQDEPNAIYQHACMLNAGEFFDEDKNLAKEKFQRAADLWHPLAATWESGFRVSEEKTADWLVFDISPAKTFADRDGRCCGTDKLGNDD